MHPRLKWAAGFAERFGDVGSECPRKSVFSRFKHHHVDAVAMTVGKVGPLTRLEIQPEPAATRGGMPTHFFDRDVKGLVGRIIAGNALKPQRRGSRSCRLHSRLHIDVRQHAMRQNLSQLKGLQNIAQTVLNSQYRLRFAGHRIGAHEDITNGIGESVKHLPANVVRVICRRIWLDAGSHVTLRADL